MSEREHRIRLRALDELASLFHRIAVDAGRPPRRQRRCAADASAYRRLRDGAPPDAVQLAYQICVQGRADLALAPDEQTGFAMTLLRLLAFEPAAGPRPRPGAAARGAREAASTSGPTASSAPASAAARALAATRRSQAAAGRPASTIAGVRPAGRGPRRARPVSAAALAPLQIADWPAFVAGLKLSRHRAATRGADRAQSHRRQRTDARRCRQPREHLIDKAYTDKLQGVARRGDRDATRSLCASMSTRSGGRDARGAGKARARRSEGQDRGARFRERPVRAGTCCRDSTRQSRPIRSNPIRSPGIPNP